MQRTRDGWVVCIVIAACEFFGEKNQGPQGRGRAGTSGGKPRGSCLEGLALQTDHPVWGQTGTDCGALPSSAA